MDINSDNIYNYNSNEPLNDSLNQLINLHKLTFCDNFNQPLLNFNDKIFYFVNKILCFNIINSNTLF